MKTNVEQIEKEAMLLEKERAKAAAANKAVIEAEENRATFHKDKQAERVEALKAKRDAVLQAYDKMLERKSLELSTARAESAAIQAKQNAELETRSEKLKADALRAFIEVGGLPADFDAHWQAVLVAQTANKLGETKQRLLKNVF